jgi:thymidine kinase
MISFYGWICKFFTERKMQQQTFYLEDSNETDSEENAEPSKWLRPSPLVYPETSAGFLSLTMGPMFSGKTTSLIHHHRFYQQQKNTPIFVINYKGDMRYDEKGIMLFSHDRLGIPCTFSETVGEIWENPDHFEYRLLHSAEVIFINEAQFFKDIFKTVLDMVEIHGKKVYLYGLDGDFQRCVFRSSEKGWLDLIPYADHIEKRKARCVDCNDDAIFSHRLTEETEQVVIGATNYIPLCRRCYLSM